MQKIINGIAIASGILSLSVVGIGGYVYLNKDAIIQEVTEKAIGGLGIGGLGGSLPSSDLPLGTNDLPSPTPQASLGLPTPSSPL
tara:strand:- start:732 stop:986 length:255 start_codon:yes stop_codon:yes gene_type:complete